MTSDDRCIELPYQPNLRRAEPVSSLQSVYTPVRPGEFRLLKVVGHDSQGCLLTNLHRQQLQDHLPYIAISYTWSEKDRLWYGKYDISSKPIRINDVLVVVSDKVANILCLALKYGRSLLWIDALCIDQSSLNERSEQVSQMGEIYSSATEILAMIGSPDASTDMVLDGANTFSRDQSHYFPPVLMSHILKFINREYWTRAWVLQELTLARSVLVCCGRRTADLRSIAELGQIMEQNVQQTESLGELSKHWRYIGTALSGQVMLRVLHSAKDLASLRPGAKEPFLDVLQNSRHHHGCSDPRDMLYSRLALASDATSLIPYPDYSIEVEDLYKRFATNCIILTGSLRVVTFANSTTMDLPSWVPDWSSKQRPWDVSKEFVQLGEEITRLSWEDEGLPRVSRCRRELMVQGRVLGQVSKRDWLETIAVRTMSFSKFSEAYHPYDIPRETDLICVLKSCPLLVHLRPVDDHFVIVGRHSIGRSYGTEVGLKTEEFEKPDTHGATQTVYSFASFEDTQSLPVRVFKIR